MKKIIGLVGGAVVIVLGSYYGMGAITEQTVKKNLASFNQSNLHVRMKAYHRGLFSSTAQLDWTIDIPSHEIKNEAGVTSLVPAETIDLTMPLKVFHGPVMIADGKTHFGLGYARTELSIPQTYNKKFNEIFTKDSTQPTLQLSLFVNYLNSSTLRLRIPKFNVTTQQGHDTLTWFGMTSDLYVSSGVKQVSGRFVLNGFEWVNNQMKAVLARASSNYDLHRTSEGLLLGDGDIAMPSLLITDKGNTLFDLEKLTIRSSSHVNDGLFDSGLDLSLQKMVALDKNYGPVHLVVSIKNIDAAIMASLNKAATTMKNKSDSERQQAVLQLLPEVPKLLNKGPVFELSELSAVSPEGTVKANVQFSLPKGDTDNPFQLIQKITGQGRFSVPVALVQRLMLASFEQKNTPQASDQTAQTTPATAASATPDNADNLNPVNASGTMTSVLPTVDSGRQATVDIDQKLANLVDSGLLSKQGDNYVIEFQLSQGQLVVNGQPFSPAMIKF